MTLQKKAWRAEGPPKKIVEGRRPSKKNRGGSQTLQKKSWRAEGPPKIFGGSKKIVEGRRPSTKNASERRENAVEEKQA